MENSKKGFFPFKNGIHLTKGQSPKLSVTSYGAIGLRSNSRKEFKVNGQSVKHYLGGQIHPNESIQLKD